MKKLLGLLLIGLFSSVFANESYYKNGKLVELENIHETRSYSGSYIDYYKTMHGQKIGITDDILVQCKEGINCSDLLTKYNLSNFSKLTDKIMIVKIEDYDNIFSISRELYESGNVDFAHPNFIKERRKR